MRLPVKRFFDVVRGIDTLIWALIWINVVGLGPFAGVLAIATSDFGALGKLFAEIVESADAKEQEGVRAAGGGRLAEVRFGLLPQVLPVIAGQILYFIESNTRSATIIGVVGAGGIGLHLSEQIRVLEWRQVSFLILLILVSVAAIDFVSGTAARRDGRPANGRRVSLTRNCHRTEPERRHDRSVDDSTRDRGAPARYGGSWRARRRANSPSRSRAVGRTTARAT